LIYFSNFEVACVKVEGHSKFLHNLNVKKSCLNQDSQYLENLCDFITAIK